MIEMPYLPSGYIDYKTMVYHDPNINFVFCIGGRGTGKTYGALEYEAGKRDFVLLRRTQIEIDHITTAYYNPFKQLNRKHGWNIQPYTENDMKMFGQFDVDEKGSTTMQNPPVCSALALATIKNIRGFDGSNVRTIVYDEFIPELHARPIKAEGTALLNAYETINRNRELEGFPPVKMVLLSNSNTIQSPILAEFGMIDICAEMKKNDEQVYIDSETGVALFLPDDSIISQKKADTALYRATRSKGYSTMALKNDFELGYDAMVGKKNLREYNAVFAVNGMTVYRHKSRFEYYVVRSSGKLGKGLLNYGYLTDDSEELFRDDQRIFIACICDMTVTFDSISTKLDMFTACGML